MQNRTKCRRPYAASRFFSLFFFPFFFALFLTVAWTCRGTHSTQRRVTSVSLRLEAADGSRPANAPPHVQIRPYRVVSSDGTRRRPSRGRTKAARRKQVSKQTRDTKIILGEGKVDSKPHCGRGNASKRRSYKKGKSGIRHDHNLG
ncbi:hypothetical protein MUK42_31896 [Musa troglodytarum]|uniref:Uncharacterized protein n=1 Tax=Musa troglodytarum TaxID=320322 RepID=A0A9E7F8H9_9LILI|nr:hypothetical protein MUK42_31896 [Musa troglodytarum]